VERPRAIASGIEGFPVRTPTLPPATHTNSYALGERDVLLVEPATPYDDERAEWLAWARGLASQGRELVGVFLTHHHADHVGGASFFKEALGLPTLAHARTAALLEDRAIGVDRTISDGEPIDLAGPTPQRWIALHTPGHASGHLCLHEASLGAVVVGDMVASVGTILVEPTDGDMIDYLAGLRRLEGLAAKVALPAHGDPIPDPSRLFRAYVAHRLLREAKVMKALEGAAEATIDALVPVAYADTPEALWPIARMSLEAHLVKLERDGQARRDGDRWRVARGSSPPASS
jgi:glyoxylase-like metal-dependent hydrolase (beta-lactamase superfamily II)